MQPKPTKISHKPEHVCNIITFQNTKKAYPTTETFWSRSRHIRRNEPFTGYIFYDRVGVGVSADDESIDYAGCRLSGWIPKPSQPGPAWYSFSCFHSVIVFTKQVFLNLHHWGQPEQPGPVAYMYASKYFRHEVYLPCKLENCFVQEHHQSG